MSGGFFDYKQHAISDIIYSLQSVISNKKLPSDFYDSGFYTLDYSPEVFEEFIKGLEYLRLAQEYTHCIDYLLSGDYGEETFLAKIKEAQQNPLTKRCSNCGQPCRGEICTLCSYHLK